MIIDGKKFRFRLQEKTYHCAMDITMDYIGGKWKSVILWYLRKDTMRFSELRQRIPDITEKMLSLQLKTLEEDGLIHRASFGSKPPLRVEYSLTPFGKTLITPLEAIAKWGRELGETEGTIEEIE